MPPNRRRSVVHVGGVASLQPLVPGMGGGGECVFCDAVVPGLIKEPFAPLDVCVRLRCV